MLRAIRRWDNAVGAAGHGGIITGDGNSYIESGIRATIPTSGIDHLRLVTDGGAACTNPTIAFYGGTQFPPIATGGGAATLTTTGSNPTKTISRVGSVVTTSSLTPGSYSWPPNAVLLGAPGYKIDAVLNTALMTTMTITAGFLVSNGVRYPTPAYTHTYPEGSGSLITYFNYFNTATMQWVTRDSALGGLGAPHVLVHYVQVGGAPSWTNGGFDAVPLQISAVIEIAGRISFTQTVLTTYQQSSGQYAGNRNYAVLLGADDGIGGANWKGRFFSFVSSDPSTRPYSNQLDISPQLVLARHIDGRAGLVGDFGPVITLGMQRSDTVDVNAAQLFPTIVDLTAGHEQTAFTIAVTSKDAAGQAVGIWSFGPGMASTNSTDAQAAFKGFDTINVNKRTNSDGNPGGYYIDGNAGSETSLTADKLSFGAGDVTITRTSNTLSFAGAANSYNFDSTLLGAGVIWAGQGVAITAGGSVTGLWLSSTSTFGVFCGSGAPSISAAKGSLYLRSDGTGVNDRMYVNHNGTTGWHAVVTVA